MSFAAPPPPASAWRRWHRALGSTFGVHVAQTSLALLAASLWAGAFQGAWAGHADGLGAMKEGGSVVVETLDALAEVWIGNAFLYTFAAAIGWWLIALPIQLWWLETMRAPAPIRDQWRRALGNVPRAIGASVLWSIAMAILVGLALVPPMLWRLAFADDPDPRWADLGLLVALVPLLGVLAIGRSWHDCARSAIVLGAGPLDALKDGWAASRAWVYAFWWIVCTALALGALSLPPPAWLVLLGGQLLLLGQRFARAAWLATAMSAVARGEVQRSGAIGSSP